MKKSLFIVLLSYSGFTCAQAPGNISDFVVWIKGDFKKNLRTISDATPVVVPGRTYPRSGLLNYNEVLHFNENNDQVSVPLSLKKGLSQATAFVVYQDFNPGSGHVVWALQGHSVVTQLSTKQVADDASSPLSYSTMNPGSPVINTYIKRWKKAVKEITDEESLVFGSGENPESAFTGKIAEFILYDRILKLTEQQKIESGLAIKYGIALQHDYLNSAGKVIWSYKKYNEYSNRIIGIGRDDAAGLYQRQSSVNDPSLFISISVGKLAESNNENKSVINDQDYLAFGDDGSDLKVELVPDLKTGIAVIRRRWLIQSYGRTASSISTEINIEADKLFPERYPAEKYIMIIDRRGKGELSTANSEYITASAVSSEGIVTFRNIYWDTDHSGTDVFTFGLNSALSTAIGTDSLRLASHMPEQISLHPNPSHDGHFTLDIVYKYPAPVEVQIFDASNRLVKTISRQQELRHQINDKITGSAGIYTFLIKSPYQNAIRRLVIR